MGQYQRLDLFSESKHTERILENLISPDPYLRDKGLEELDSMEGFQDHPIMVYMLSTRILDPDLEVRFHAIQILGKLLQENLSMERMPEKSFLTVTEFTTQLEKQQLIKLLEVAEAYLAAEGAITSILKLCSYAGKGLGGIVNDRRLPVEIRQQAIHFCGEVGFLTTVTVIQNLIQRVEKNRSKPGLIKSRKKHLDEESLFPYAVTALGKLEGSLK